MAPHNGYKGQEGPNYRKHIIALRWCRESIHYDWLKRINSDEPKRANHLPVSLKLGPNSTDADNLPPNIARVEQIQATKKQI